MERTISNKLSGSVDKIVKLQGWLHTVRKLGNISFVILRDRGGLAQIVVEQESEIAKLDNIYTGSIITVTGKCVASPKSKYGYEIQNGTIEVDVPVNYPSPIDITKEDINAELDTALNHRPVYMRHPKIASIFRVQAGILKAFRNSMEAQEFTEFVSPVLIGVPSESGASVFEVNYFNKKAYLAQSPQIYKQIMVGTFERVFTIAKVFRAEKHNTSRHLMEIVQMDGEMGFVKSYDEVLDVIEKVVRDILKYLDENHKSDLELHKVELPLLPKDKFPRVKVKEALAIIEKRTGKSANREELDLDPEDEREIAKWAVEEFNSDFLWLLNFKKNKNFYTWNNVVGGAPSVTKETEDADESLSYDLECRGLEWLSGTHRIHVFEKLLENLKNQGLKPEHYVHYLDAFKYGIPSEAGFSFGLERLTKQIFNLENIREATNFPCDLNRVAGYPIEE
jgi:nondiscriminating aspartyl-tRNA synthetase